MTAPPPNAKVTSKASDGCRRCIIDRMVHNGLGSELIAVSDYDRKDAGVCGTPPRPVLIRGHAPPNTEEPNS
jgi:hypothetical protein